MAESGEKEFISIVMPVYREAAHIGEVLKDVHKALVEADVRFEIILVEDGSPDDTWKALVEQSKNYPMMRAARLSRNFGKEHALCAGLEMARGDAVIVMDADGQHPPAILPKIISTWRESDADIVECTKIDRGEETLFSKVAAGMFYWLWNKLSGFEMRGASDYKLLSRPAVDAYLEMDERNVFFRGMTAWLGFTRAQVPFEVAVRAGGSTSWSIMHRVKLALTGISGFSSLPLQFVTFTGLIFLLFSVLFGIYTLILQIKGSAATGFSTVILLLLVIGSLLMISLGIIGIYLARIYDEIKGRPRYVISQRIEPNEAATPQRRKNDSSVQPLFEMDSNV
ncbi:MAG: glycosyltransferase family 2 protein [Chloracidobacterium sp.]|nr:glycosyltransferase family 2 protein [Chloracidobacterium sp.]